MEELDDLLVSLLEGNAAAGVLVMGPLFLASLSAELVLVADPARLMLVTAKEEGVVGMEEEEGELPAVVVLSVMQMEEEAEAAEGIGCTEDEDMFTFPWAKWVECGLACMRWCGLLLVLANSRSIPAPMTVAVLWWVGDLMAFVPAAEGGEPRMVSLFFTPPPAPAPA